MFSLPLHSQLPAPSTYSINTYQMKDMKIKRHNDQNLCELYTDDK